MEKIARPVPVFFADIAKNFCRLFIEDTPRLDIKIGIRVVLRDGLCHSIPHLPHGFGRDFLYAVLGFQLPQVMGQIRLDISLFQDFIFVRIQIHFKKLLPGFKQSFLQIKGVAQVSQIASLLGIIDNAPPAGKSTGLVHQLLKIKSVIRTSHVALQPRTMEILVHRRFHGFIKFFQSGFEKPEKLRSQLGLL